MERTLFREEHQLFRRTVRAFLDRDVVPHQKRWMEAGIVDRDAWRRAGTAGLLCPWLEETHSGPGRLLALGGGDGGAGGDPR